MRKHPSFARRIARLSLGILLCFVGFCLATLSFTLSEKQTAAAPHAYVWATTTIPDTSSLAPALREPVNATFRWIASFTPGASNRHIARTGPSAGTSLLPGMSTASLSPFVSDAVAPTLSPRVSDLPAESPLTLFRGQREEGELTNREPEESVNPLERDSVVQTVTAPTVGMPPVGASFEGMNNSQACDGCIPPDPTGAVGPNHYVQMVNSSFAIYSKSGALVSPPKHINSLWSAVPNSTCAPHNNGDPIVIYDQLADRWLLSQFTVQSGTENYAECIAISQTSDPTGSYWLYQFDESSDTFHDYPHIGLWPDGYYMTTNLFPNSGLLFSSGAGAWAFERPKMLAGQPARYVYFDETPLATQTYTPGGQLPTSLEGKNLPPTGAPNYFVEVDNANQPNTPPAAGLHDEMHIWKFHVDWTNPGSATFGLGSTSPAPAPGIPGQYAANAGQPNFVLPIADYVPVPCQFVSGPSCIPQKVAQAQPPEFLEALGDRLMYRVTYRNFGDHEALVVSHTALAPADQPDGAQRAGVRWYELRSLSGTPLVYQQSTFAPLDPTSLNGPLWRWMGSAAMDHGGNLAIGYNASGPNYFPSMHYAGRLVSDPLNELTQGEAVLFAGLGIEVAVPDYLQRNRWGDYSTLTVDPTDDCTFWYTNEYINTNTPSDAILSIDWHTRIGSFKFPQCVPPTLQLTQVASRKTHGGAGTFDIPLPQTGTRGVECRSGGPNGDFTLVFQFANPITNCGSSPNGAVQPGANANECVVQLTGVPNAQYVTVALNGVLDDHSNRGGVTATFGVLFGDTTGNGVVTNTDVGAVKAQVDPTTAVTQSNFRHDVSVNGFVTNTDVGATKAQVNPSGGLPSLP
jgi:hypothetical protein